MHFLRILLCSVNTKSLAEQQLFSVTTINIYSFEIHRLAINSWLGVTIPTLPNFFFRFNEGVISTLLCQTMWYFSNSSIHYTCTNNRRWATNLRQWDDGQGFTKLECISACIYEVSPIPQIPHLWLGFKGKSLSFLSLNDM